MAIECWERIALYKQGENLTFTRFGRQGQITQVSAPFIGIYGTAEEYSPYRASLGNDFKFKLEESGYFRYPYEINDQRADSISQSQDESNIRNICTSRKQSAEAGKARIEALFATETSNLKNAEKALNDARNNKLDCPNKDIDIASYKSIVQQRKNELESKKAPYLQELQTLEYQITENSDPNALVKCAAASRYP